MLCRNQVQLIAHKTEGVRYLEYDKQVFCLKYTSKFLTNSVDRVYYTFQSFLYALLLNNSSMLRMPSANSMCI